MWCAAFYGKLWCGERLRLMWSCDVSGGEVLLVILGKVIVLIGLGDSRWERDMYEGDVLSFFGSAVVGGEGGFVVGVVRTEKESLVSVCCAYWLFLGFGEF